MGSSGLWDLIGSFRIFSRWRLRLGCSLNKGSAWGLWITGFASKSSTDFFLGARATQTRAPLSLRVGSYSTWVPPWLLSPAVTNIFREKRDRLQVSILSLHLPLNTCICWYKDHWEGERKTKQGMASHVQNFLNLLEVEELDIDTDTHMHSYLWSRL